VDVGLENGTEDSSVDEEVEGAEIAVESTV